MRFSPTDIAAGKLINFFAADDFQKHQLGLRTSVVSSDYSTAANFPNAGGGEAAYVRCAATLATGRLVVYDKDLNIIDLPVTGNTGRPFAVALSNFTASSPFGWVLISGIAPVQFSVAATVGPVFGGSAGQATPTPAAGRQLLNMHCLVGGAGAITKGARLRNGTPFITLTNSDVGGMFPGQVLSGITGIPGGATVTSLDPDGVTVRMSANATTSNSGTMTITNTGFGICQMRYPFVQGQIT